MKPFSKKFLENPFSIYRILTYVRTDRQTDINDQANRCNFAYFPYDVTKVWWESRCHGHTVRGITNYFENFLFPCPVDSTGQKHVIKKVVKFDIDRRVQCYVHYWCALAEKTKTPHAMTTIMHVSSSLISYHAAHKHSRCSTPTLSFCFYTK